MDEQSAAIINFFGQTFGQMKEIDKNIEAAGSNAKFGGRSAEVEKALRGFVEQIQTPSPVPAAPLPVQTTVVTQPVISTQVPMPVYVQQPQQEEQLELKFSTSDKDVLNSIYNVLFDIKKLLSEAVELQKQQQQTVAVKKEKKTPTLASCCLCGGTAKGKKVNEKLYTVACESCGNSEDGINESVAKVSWNNKNKQL